MHKNTFLDMWRFFFLFRKVRFQNPNFKSKTTLLKNFNFASKCESLERYNAEDPIDAKKI